MPEAISNWQHHTSEGKMKKALLLFVITVLLIPITACGSSATAQTSNNFNFIFKYGVSGGNTLDTFQGTYIRDLILDPAITINLVLTAEEMDSIYQKMLEIDFFNYPDKFSVNVADNETKTEVAPYPTYFFSVVHDGKTKQLLWHAKYVNTDPPADKLKGLINLIITIIESKDEYKALPPPSGGYL
jgi:hypothetical protein